MAIVFISPQKKQRMFFITIATLFVLILFILSLITFIPKIEDKFKNIPENGDMSISDIKINFGMVDSEKVKKMELISEVGKEFNYTAQGRDNKKVAGKISATDVNSAQKTLETMGFKVLTIEETAIGRSNPFFPY